MAAEKLVVKNFGPIRDAELDLRKVTVLIGPQASGKSVLAKLVAIFGDILLEKGDLKSAAWDFYRLESFVKRDTVVVFNGASFQQKFDGELTQEMLASELSDYFHDYQKTRMQFKTDLLNSQMGNSLSEAERKAMKDNREDMATRIKYLKVIGGSPKYFPAERSLVPLLSNAIFQFLDNNIKIPKFLTSFAAEYESSRQAHATFNISFLKTVYTFRAGKDKVMLANNQEIELSESATGFQTSIPIAVIIEALETGKHLFIIEEPELNLYPTTQKKLVEYLIAKCTKGENRLIITTHSPYILTALNNCIEANNALKANPEAKSQVDALVPPESQIAFEDVAAYYVADGTARSIMNEEYQMIDANALDDVSDELSNIHSELLDLKYQLQD